MLDIRTKTMFGTTHSWAITMRSLFEEFCNNDHNIYIESTNGDSFVSDEMKKRFMPCESPDIDICYTLPRNFPFRFKDSSKLKLAIYNYESSILPELWRDKIKHVDYALPSSSFSKEIFVKNGWPEDKCIVVPHGVKSHMFSGERIRGDLKNNKKFRFLNISIPHFRKNISSLVDAYYSSFSDRDDVCLVIKTSLKSPNPNHPFECDVTKEILKVQKTHSGRALPQIEIVEKKYDDMSLLYRSCDCLVSASSSEGFGLPFLEGLAAGMVVIAPECSGQLDFLNNKNSLLVSVTDGPASKRYQYWSSSDGAKTFFPNKISLSEQMINAYSNHKGLLSSFDSEIKTTLSKFTWSNAADRILELV